MSAYTTLYVSAPAARGSILRAVLQAPNERLENFLNYLLQERLFTVIVSGEEPQPDDRML